MSSFDFLSQPFSIRSVYNNDIDLDRHLIHSVEGQRLSVKDGIAVEGQRKQSKREHAFLFNFEIE